METLLKKHWHHLPKEEVTDLLNSNAHKGLSKSAAQKRLKNFGKNIIPGAKKTPLILLFLKQFHQPLVYVLLVATIVTASLKDLTDAIVIFAVIFVNSLIGFFQESKAQKSLDSLAKRLSTKVNVLRDGKKQKIDSELIIPGDIVVLESGDKIPADIRILETKNCQVSEALLTGESLPIHKEEGCLGHDTPLAERHNMLYASTLVVKGRAQGVVVATGVKTELGQIAELIKKTEEIQTPLTKKITSFSHLLVYAILGMAAITFAIGYFRGEETFDLFMSSVALAVGMIPEGLPAVLTITLAIGVNNMAKRKAIVRKLAAVETLGSTTVICTDKTGTLTKNEMMVSEIYVDGTKYEISGEGYSLKGALHEANENNDTIKENIALTHALTAGVICNDTELEIKNNIVKPLGDPTEIALHVAGIKAGITPHKDYKRIDYIPFESEHKYMATLCAHKKEHIIFLKGAAEKVLTFCNTQQTADGKIIPFDQKRYQEVFQDMAERGLRIIGLCYKKTSSQKKEITADDVEKDMVFLGFAAIVDPPRNEVKSAIKNAQQAGITIKMITGDHALTALSIAQQINIEGAQSKKDLIDGSQLEKLSDEELRKVAKEKTIFARVTPEQKLRIVTALQHEGEIVAMTGDGVNDAPALKKADIGVAMGKTGTDVARETAEIVLVNDNFVSIEAAVEEGRSIFNNIIKFIVWTLPTNLGEGGVVLIAIIFGLTLPLLPIHILWINLTTALFLGLMLAFEPVEKDIMKKPPRIPNSPILTKPHVLRIFLVGGIMIASALTLYEYALIRGLSEDKAHTIVVNTFVAIEAFYLLNCRSLAQSAFSQKWNTNPWILLGITLMLIAQAAFTYLPAMNFIFKTEPISMFDISLTLLAGLVAFILIEGEKKLTKKWHE